MEAERRILLMKTPGNTVTETLPVKSLRRFSTELFLP